MQPIRTLAGSVLLLATVVSGSAAQNIVSNPGFETGNFSSWVGFGNMANSGVDILVPHSGVFAAYFGPVVSTGGISQTLATSIGAEYTFSFWLRNGNKDELAEFAQVSWDGAPVFTLTNAGQVNYTLFSFDVVATAPATDIVFNFQNGESFWDLDDVSVVAATTSTVPEPATMTLLATGLVALAGMRRRSLAERQGRK